MLTREIPQSLYCHRLFVGYTSLTRNSGRRGLGSLLGFERRVEWVFRGLSFEVPFTTPRVAIVGPNGSGKSTLLGAIAGLVPSHGEISWKEQRLDHLTPQQRRGAGLIFIPHESGVFPGLTVRENLELMTQAGPNGKRSITAALSPLSRQLKDLPRNELRFLESTCRAGDLSGGQRKLLSLMRLFFLSAEFVLIDEPTSGLSPTFLTLLGGILRHAEGSASMLVAEQYSREEMLRNLGFQILELKDDSLVEVRS